MIRLLLTDLDGTITIDRGSYILDLNAIESLRRAEKSGIKVAIVSGNSYPVLRGLQNYLGFSGGIVAENGCLVFYQGVTIRTCEVVPRSLVSEFAKTFNLKESWQNEFRKSDFGYTPAIITDEMIEWANQRGLMISSSGYALHLSGKPGGKGVGVRKLLDIMNLNENQVAAIGDSKTDVDMFKYAAIKAAVSNADQDLIKSANVVLKLKSGNGITELVNMLLR
ncbi:MAG: phosphoglycolate phosphatase [Metallosphaera sp.]